MRPTPMILWCWLLMVGLDGFGLPPPREDLNCFESIIIIKPSASEIEGDVPVPLNYQEHLQKEKQ